MLKAKQIINQAVKLRRKLKGKTDFVSVEEYLNIIGYKVIFFNTPVGDAELQRYNLSEKAQKTKAFTYRATAKIVFIDNDISPEDKTYVLYHELGHIELGHLDYKRMSTINKILMEFQADTFACALL